MIMAKFSDRSVLTEELFTALERLFSAAGELPGVKGARLIRNIVDRENRYDLLIEIDMTPEALPVWDGSDIHRRWKAEYGALLQSKAIFDRA